MSLTEVVPATTAASRYIVEELSNASTEVCSSSLSLGDVAAAPQFINSHPRIRIDIGVFRQALRIRRNHDVLQCLLGA